MKQDRSVIWIFIVLALVVAGIFLLMNRQNSFFEKSPFGNAGLTKLLKSQDLEVETANARISREADDFGVQIIPLQTSNLLTDDYWKTVLYDPDGAREMYADEFEAKLNTLPTLVIMPKWTEEASKDLEVHDEAIYSIDMINSFWNDIGGLDLVIERGKMEFVTSNGVTLFAPQYFITEQIPPNCEPLFGTDYGTLIISCQLDDYEQQTLFASDPDMFNNHGLSVADNSIAAVDFIKDWIASKSSQTIYMDVVSELTLSEELYAEERRDYERTSSDLLRLLQYPINVILGLTLLIFGILFWRGYYRFGEPQTIDDVEDRKDVSSRASLDASAYLKRLTGNDPKIVADFVRQHLRSVSMRLLGSAADKKPIESLYSYLSKQNSNDANQFIECANKLMEETTLLNSRELNHMIMSYRTLAKKVIDPNEFE